jgi:hypothetical protein
MSLFQDRNNGLLHTKQWSDADRCAFLQNLDNAEGVEVNSFEAEFIESALNRIIRAKGDYEVTFSIKQREVIESMYAKYHDSF